MYWNLKKSALTVISSVLLLSGSALLISQVRTLFTGNTSQTEASSLHITHLQGQASELQGVFKVDSVDNIAIQRNGKDAFSLFLAHYKDNLNQERRALLFPKGNDKPGILGSPTGIRQAIWEEAGAAISKHTEKNAVILSWWDDGQRIHFLSGRDTWVSRPSDETFMTPVWRQLQGNILSATDDEKIRLYQMARWLTMDAGQALAEIRQSLDSTKPVYIVVTNDLLMRLGEMADYGGAQITFHSTIFQAHDNLHGDIANIREWAGEHGNGNYLVQKEGFGYRAWSTPIESESVKRTLIVRLLPFVESLKKLPDGVQLVYQSHWGGYLSIYKIHFV